MTLDTLSLVALLGAASLIALVLRTLFVLRRIRTARRQRQWFLTPTTTPITSSLKTLVVLGSGGHTTEMLNMVQSLNAQRYTPLVFVKAQTDTTSAVRLQQATPLMKLSQEEKKKNNVVVLDIPRSREVGQSYGSSILTTLYATLACVRLLLRHRPNLILCNGPGTCLPIAVGGFFLGRVLGLFPHPLVFVESFCRVQTLSLTGKLLLGLGLADLVVVHWPELHQRYPDDTVLSSQFVAQSTTTTQTTRQLSLDGTTNKKDQ